MVHDNQQNPAEMFLFFWGFFLYLPEEKKKKEPQMCMILKCVYASVCEIVFHVTNLCLKKYSNSIQEHRSFLVLTLADLELFLN